MKRFAAFVKKEFYHIGRDKRTILILLIMPIVQIIIFGFALSMEVKNVRVAVIQSDPTDVVVNQMVAKLDNNEYFNVVSNLSSTDQAYEQFLNGTIDLVLIFGDEFGNSLYTPDGSDLLLAIDASESNMAKSWNMYASSILASYVEEYYQAGQSAVGIVPNIKFLYNPEMKSSYNFVTGLLGFIMILICAMMTSISIVREKERGTMEVLLVTPVKPMHIIISKMVPYFVLSCINLISILLLSYFLLGVPISGSLFWLVIVSLIYIFTSLSLGLLISSLTSTQVAAMLVSGMMLIMPSLLLSGMLFPIESMPKILQYISAIIPPRWYISAVRKLMIEGVSISFCIQEISILLAMLALLVGVSYKKFKTRLE